MIKLNKNNILIIISFVIGTVFGSGSLWTYLNHELNNEKYVFEKQKDLRVRRDENLKTIIELGPIIRTRANEDLTKQITYDEKLRLLQVQLSKSVEDFNNDEIELAKLEIREPFQIKIDENWPKGGIVLDFIPPTCSVRIITREEMKNLNKEKKKK